MPKQTPNEKAERRLAKVFSNLVGRREFVTAAAAVGLTITKPADLAAATATRDEAIMMAYFAFWGGAEGNVEAEGEMRPGEIEKKYPTKYNLLMKAPNDGHDGPNFPRKTRHEPRTMDNAGPKMAREWLIWRVTPKFEEFKDEWGAWAEYTLSNCARMGVVARRLASNDLSQNVRWEHAFRAFYRVRDNPLMTPAPPLAAKINRPLDQLCE